MAELALGVPTPTVHLAKCGSRDCVTEAALDRVNTLTCLFEASDDLWDVIRVDVTQAQLTILVVLANSVHVALLTYEESEVVATRYTLDVDLFAEGHQDWVADLLSLHREGPGEGLASLSRHKVQVTARSERADHQVLPREEGQPCGFKDILVVSKAKLPPLVATKDD